MKIVFAYSGGLDTSVLLSWIKEKYNAEMIAFCADIGQEEELNGLEKKAMQDRRVQDLHRRPPGRIRHATSSIPMIRAGAIYEGQYFLGTSIARPLIAKRMVEIAKAGKGRRHRPRRDRQGQRPGPLRTHRRRARAGLAGHRPVARRALSQRIPRPRRR